MKLASRMERIKPSPTLAIDARAKALKKEGKDVAAFGAGEPDFDTPDHIKQAAIKAIQEGFTKYTPAAGVPELREAVAKRIKQDLDLDYAAGQVVISCGAKHSIYNIFQAALQEGDKVLYPAPYWVSYADMAAITFAEPVAIPTSPAAHFLVTPQQLERHLTPDVKIFVLNSPCNPTGSAYSREQLIALGEVLKKHDCLILSDDIYDAITFDGFKAYNMATLVPALRDRMIVVNGVSKSFSMTGWRIGWAAGPRMLMDAAADLQSQSTSNPSSIAQKAALAAVTGPRDFIGKMVEAFDRRRKLFVEGLNSIPGVTCLKPHGAFYVFPSIEGIIGKRYKGRVIEDDNVFADLLLAEKLVAVVPGSAFGCKGFIRLSYATSEETIRKGLDRIADFVEALE
ncbi:MAG: Aspartate aminotransferase [Myxococcota bacterium]|nr:Aspartate aminotransferase [Myxococcota bacterium]